MSLTRVPRPGEYIRAWPHLFSIRIAPVLPPRGGRDRSILARGSLGKNWTLTGAGVQHSIFQGDAGTFERPQDVGLPAS